MLLPGKHLDLCDAEQFHIAWEALGDLTDEECDKIEENLIKDTIENERHNQGTH